MKSKLKKTTKKHASEIKELHEQVKELKNAMKSKDKEKHDLSRNIENARVTIKNYKAEKSHLKMCKTKLEAEVRKLEKTQHHKQKEILVKTFKSEEKDENANIETFEAIASSYPPAPAEFSNPSFTPSMVSHHNPHLIETFQRPASITSMISHCALSPPPGSSFLTMVEVMEALEEALEKMFQSMTKKWCSNSSSN